MGKSDPRLSFAENFMLSGTAAVISKTVAAPIERVKMVVQNQAEMVRSGILEKPFTGIMDCSGWIMKNEGPLAFWKSNFTNCLRYFPTQALNFAFKDQVKAMGLKPGKTDQGATKLVKNVISGGLAGGGSLCFVYSLDYARTRLANDLKGAKKGGGERQYSGLADVYKKTWESDGIRGLYRGFNISFVGIFVYRGFYFGLYDTIMPMLGDDAGFFVSFCVGYAVTVLAGLASYPIDTIRRRMMMNSGLAIAEQKYKSSMHAFTLILKEEGIAAYFRGASANIFRGLGGTLVLVGFDYFTEFYADWKYGGE